MEKTERRSTVGEPGLAGSDRDNLCSRTLAPACTMLLGGGTACWWERSLVPRACSLVACSIPSSICPFIYYLLLSLALSSVSWFLMLLARKGAVLWGAPGQQQMLLYSSFVSLSCCGDRSVWHTQLNSLTSFKLRKGSKSWKQEVLGVPHMVHALLFRIWDGYAGVGEKHESLWKCMLYAAKSDVGKSEVTRCSKEILDLFLLH